MGPMDSMSIQGTAVPLFGVSTGPESAKSALYASSSGGHEERWLQWLGTGLESAGHVLGMCGSGLLGSYVAFSVI